MTKKISVIYLCATSFRTPWRPTALRTRYLLLISLWDTIGITVNFVNILAALSWIFYSVLAHGTFIGKIRLEGKKPEHLMPDKRFSFGASSRGYILRYADSVFVSRLYLNIILVMYQCDWSPLKSSAHIWPALGYSPSRWLLFPWTQIYVLYNTGIHQNSG